ncbi:hypothetical protein STENM223S_02923 [Streptomyces tendae]
MALGTVTASYELRFDTGRVCLDLLATTHPGERLGSVDALRAWITGAGLVPEGTPLTHADPSWLGALRELRADLVPLVRAPGSPSYGRALARVNDLARSAPPAPRAVPGADGTVVLGSTARPDATRCSARWRGTRWTCSPTRPPARACVSARATTAPSCTSTAPVAGGAAGAPARCAASAYARPGTAAVRQPSPVPEHPHTRAGTPVPAVGTLGRPIELPYPLRGFRAPGIPKTTQVISLTPPLDLPGVPPGPPARAVSEM